jgi:hypothetical protein
MPELRPTSLRAAWNLLTEMTDAVICPYCRHPIFETRDSEVVMSQQHSAEREPQQFEKDEIAYLFG